MTAIIAKMASINSELDASGSKAAVEAAPTALPIEKLNAALAVALDAKEHSERAVVNLADHVSEYRTDIDRILAGNTCDKNFLKTLRNGLSALSDVTMVAIKISNFTARLQYEIAALQKPAEKEKEN